MEEKVFFEDSKGNRLCGILSTVASGSRAPVVVLCHGLNRSKESRTVTQLGAILARNEIASLRLDFFAHGESDGRPEDRSLSRFAEDILSAVSYLRGIGYKTFGVVGISIAGVATVIAAPRIRNLGFMALRSPGVGKVARGMPNYKGDFDSKVWHNYIRKEDFARMMDLILDL